MHPLELLGLDATAQLITNTGRQHPELALVLALCRLLVPSLKYRGSGRHLVVEAWTEDDIRGETLAVDVPTQFARELSAAQAEDFRVVVAGEKPPEGSLPELFWSTQTALPVLPPTFEDSLLGRLAHALYFHLVPEGD